MKNKSLWEFIGDNFLSLVTIVSGIFVIVLASANLIEDRWVSSAILGLLSLLATSEIVDKTRKLNRIEECLNLGFQNVLNKKDGEVIVWSWTETDEYLRYLQKRLRQAKSSYDHAAISPPLPRQFNEMSAYESELEKIFLANTIRYRYVAILTDPTRVTRIRKYLLNKKVKKYFVGYLDFDPEKMPMPSFSIIDEEELLLYFPPAYGELESWVSIKDTELAKIYLSYFRRLWEQSTKITNANLNVLTNASHKLGCV
jgi:hypothetical protein